MSGMYCGLCKKQVNDWPSHVLSEEHIKNTHDKNKLSEAFDESQKDLLKEIHGGEIVGIAPSPFCGKEKKRKK